MLCPIVTIASAMKIGQFNLPYRTVDTNLSHIVRHVVTNDVTSYCCAVASFTPPFTNENHMAVIDYENSPGTTIYLPSLFEDGIEFRIEDGQTNCVIKQALTDAVKAVEAELPLMTNLTATASSFIASFQSGSATNLSFSEKCRLMRSFENGQLRTISENDTSEEEMNQNVRELCEDFTYYPLCIMDIMHETVGTNTYYGTIYRHHLHGTRTIDADHLIFFDGYWSLLIGNE